MRFSMRVGLSKTTIILTIHTSASKTRIKKTPL